MDAYDLFRKLGAGAKFDFNRFRSDAEKLHILKRKQPAATTTTKKSQKGVQQGFKKKVKSEDSETSDESSGSESDSEVEIKAASGSDSSESSQSSSDSDEEEAETIRESGPKDEAALKLLGNITAKDDQDMSSFRTARKAKKKKVVDPAQKMADLKQEQVNHRRNVNRIHAYGTDIPEPIETFQDLKLRYNIHSRIIQNIESAGYTAPTPIQMQAIPVMLNRREIMACAPTGSGKTAAFLLPILHHLKEPRNDCIRALVLSPTRELAKQTYRECQRLSEGIGFRILYIDKIGKDLQKVQKATKKIDIMVSTPNRLIYLLKQTEAVISLRSVEWFVVDESDKLFEEGKTGFRDQLALIYKSCDGSGLRRAMFSATFAYDVEEWCKLNLDNVVQVYVGAKNAATKTIEQSLLFCGAETGKMIALRNIIRQGIQPPVLVFVQSKERAKELFHELIYDGMNVDVIHADRTQTQRDNVIKCFRSGKIWILICTELMGRGIDFKGVNLVINYDFPNSAISYIHRIGRTGRAGRTGKAITFFTEDDAIYLRSIANVMRTAGCPVPDYMLKINQPNRRDRKVLSKGAIRRPQISTMTKYDQQKQRHKKQVIQDSRRKKQQQQSGDPSHLLKPKLKQPQETARSETSGQQTDKKSFVTDTNGKKAKKRKFDADAGKNNTDGAKKHKHMPESAKLVQLKYKKKWKEQRISSKKFENKTKGSKKGGNPGAKA
ncbi:probable ATP-dependent RNA helicase DDX52 [Dreissena polymorpha]|uniref:Probable ATP-dependent RNA helicase DDX52 n=1 Tax=Dreissena polymorpha TaxID=45954 RepID=A0A9D4KRJ7_DREPO|nr:probable ATP-dependent RNA helicase DDX52 [Dreissena polymorpha]KAH3844480.1 hypothetical protein DPMN_086738 [Dreissena polymorpha]